MKLIMFRALMILVPIAMLAGCAAGVKKITTPDGRLGYLISCDGSADDWSTCYAEATKLCGKYNIIDRNEASTPTNYGPLVRRHLVAEYK